MNGRFSPLTTMADGTLKQINPFSGTQVWTVPGRGNRPLTKTIKDPRPLSPEDHTQACAFCSDRPLDTPPEKARIFVDPSARTGWTIKHRALPEELDDNYEFRRVPNLFEIVPYSYWVSNYDFSPEEEILEHQRRYESSPIGREHIERIVDTRLKAAGRDPQNVDPTEREQLATGYFAGGHDVIISRRHFRDGAKNDNELLSAGLLTPEEHYALTLLTVDTVRDLYHRNRYAPYVAAFQNWLAPAGASFEHLHKQIVAIDERGVQGELEIEKLRRNPNMYNEWAVDYAGYHNLTIAENEHAVMIAGVGHRYPTIELYSKSSQCHPWLQEPEEIRGLSDLLHAVHAATGPEVACNEEWHHQPIDLDLPMPWRINVKWRVSNLAGFEGGTKIYINTLSPADVRDRVVPALYRLRDEGKLADGIRIATEASTTRNQLRYNPVLSG